VDRDDPYLVRKALEIGAGGVIVPDICSVQQAESVVQAAKFPPLGNRGFSRNCWSAAWGAISADEWVQWSNREPMIGIMIENVEAMSSIDAIVAVEGIDFVLFGPADFSMSLGLAAPDAEDERVQAAITQTASAVRAHGKYFSFSVGTDAATIARYKGLGVTMLELGNDLGSLRTSWTRARNAIDSAE
jgi:2-keto-3-deoxy-L-rhamnonate aldolase RhmA